MRQQKYTQTQQVIDTLRTKEGMLRLCRDKLKDNSFNMFRCKE